MLLQLAPTALCCCSTWVAEANKTHSPLACSAPLATNPALFLPSATAPASAVRSREREKKNDVRHIHWVTARLPSPLVWRYPAKSPTSPRPSTVGVELLPPGCPSPASDKTKM